MSAYLRSLDTPTTNQLDAWQHADTHLDNALHYLEEARERRSWFGARIAVRLAMDAIEKTRAPT